MKDQGEEEDEMESAFAYIDERDG